MKLTVKNFLGLPDLTWEPSGVCLLTGPNGSGKTSLLQAFAFMRNTFEDGVSKAVLALGSARGLKRQDAHEVDPVVLSLEVEGLLWELELAVQAGAVNQYPGERLVVDGETVIRRISGSKTWDLGEKTSQVDIGGHAWPCLRNAWELEQKAQWKPLIDAIRGVVIHDPWTVATLRSAAVGFADDVALDSRGENLFVVLHNWRANPRLHEDRFDWVLKNARLAFGDIFDDIAIVPQGDVLTVRLFGAKASKDGLPVRRAADGLLVGLLHLTAVASATDGSLIALDEMENQLHPHAIRVILAAIRELAEERDLTVILTTHSPVLMDEFAEATDQFFVTERGAGTFPVSLDALHDPRWLAQSSLGSLYERLRIGAPPVPRG